MKKVSLYSLSFCLLFCLLSGCSKKAEPITVEQFTSGLQKQGVIRDASDISRAYGEATKADYYYGTLNALDHLPRYSKIGILFWFEDKSERVTSILVSSAAPRDKTSAYHSQYKEYLKKIIMLTDGSLTELDADNIIGRLDPNGKENAEKKTVKNEIKYSSTLHGNGDISVYIDY